MKLTRAVFLSFGLVAALYATGLGDYYYSGGGQINLTIDSLKVAIKFDDGASRSTIIQSIDRIVNELVDDNMINEFFACSLSTASGYDNFLDSLDTIVGIYLVEPYYLAPSGFPAPTGDVFYVEFHDTVSGEVIDSINDANNVVVIEYLDTVLSGFGEVYVLNNTDSSDSRLLSLANAYYDLAVTSFSHPQLGVPVRTNTPYRLYDFYKAKQYHTLRVLGNYSNLPTWDSCVWDFAGLDDTIIVAVIDEGIVSHEDLPASRILPGMDYFVYPPDNDPSPADSEFHGMNVAGIIAASHTTDSVAGMGDSTGIISLNPNIKIVPIRAFGGKGTGRDPRSQALSIRYAYGLGGADVINCSWGYEDYSLSFDILNTQISRAYIAGRGGLGCPMMFAAGNTSGDSYCGEYGCRVHIDSVHYPANLMETMAVGASKVLSDLRWGYSCFGSQLDILAPSGDGYLLPDLRDVWTIDLMGNAGANPDEVDNCWLFPSWVNDADYFCGFSGTSAATPIVSGIASLIIAKDSTLVVDSVYSIIKHSARDSLGWGVIDDANDSLHYGHGLVDAFRAILSLTRGDPDNDDDIDATDMVYIRDYLWLSGAAPFPSVLMADCDCNSIINIADLT